MMYLNISCVVDDTSVQQVGLPCEVFHLLGPLQVLRQGTHGSSPRDWALNSQFLHENTNHTVEKLEKRLLHIYLNQMALFRRCYQKAAVCHLWNSQIDGFLLKHKIIVENSSPITPSATFCHPEFLLYCWCWFFWSLWKKTVNVKRKCKTIFNPPPKPNPKKKPQHVSCWLRSLVCWQQAG